MATRRSRYMKISDLILDEDWDDATLATVVRLLAWMRQRWAREKLTSAQGIEALVSVYEAKRITRLAGRGDRALVRLESLGSKAGLTSYSAEIRHGQASDFVWIRWPKVAEYQQWEALDSGDATPDDRPLRRSGSRRSGAPAHEEEEHPPSAGVAAEISAPASAASDPGPPEPAVTFAEQFREALARLHPGWKPPTDAAFARWVSEARLLLRERGDEATRETARWLFDASTANADAEFWRSVVLSVPKFREKFDAIAAQRRRAPPARRGGFDPEEAKRVALKVLHTKGGLE